MPDAGATGEGMLREGSVRLIDQGLSTPIMDHGSMHPMSAALASPRARAPDRLRAIVTVVASRCCAAILGACIAGAGAMAQEPCAIIALHAPSGSIDDPRPTFRWQPIAGVDQYRVRIESRVPEGGVIETIDTLVMQAEFTPPRVLTDYRAVVKVIVTPLCQVAPALDEGERIVIDTAQRCVLQAVSFDAARWMWTWPGVPGAASYEVYEYEMPAARPAAKQETRATETSRSSHRAAVAAVRPRCASGYGEFVFAVATP
jgi:hypothetical protein